MAQSFNTSLKNVAALYLGILQAKVSATTVKKDLQEHPYFPSLLSLSETFSKYHIKNSAFEIDKNGVIGLEAPFVAYMTMPGIGKDFVLISKIATQTVTYLYKNDKEATLSKEMFLKQYQNIVWVAEPDMHSGEPEYEKILKEEKSTAHKKLAWIIGITALLLFAIEASIPDNGIIAFVSIITIKITGILAAGLLLVYEIDKSNAFLKNICSAGSQTNCDAVVGSKASKIFGISWGEIGFFYFTATALLLLIPAIPFIDKVKYIVICTAFAAPYILFSICYQWRVLKQWCPLCLTVQAVLISECIWAAVNIRLSPLVFRFDNKYTLFFIPCILIPILSWYGLKHIFLRAKDADLYKAAYSRLQHNPDIFSGLLLQQSKAPNGWQHLGIRLGNPAAANTIIKVCNPYCGPCAKAHPILEDIIKHNSNSQLIIIFTTKNKPNDISSTVVKHLLAIAAENNETKTQKSLDDWYLVDEKYYSSFATKYPIEEDLDYHNEKLEAMASWCEAAEIRHTPTFFVNGYRLPENYHVEELRHVL